MVQHFRNRFSRWNTIATKVTYWHLEWDLGKFPSNVNILPKIVLSRWLALILTCWDIDINFFLRPRHYNKKLYVCRWSLINHQCSLAHNQQLHKFLENSFFFFKFIIWIESRTLTLKAIIYWQHKMTRFI